MGFWTLFEASSFPILQVLLISGLGAFMSTERLNLLPTDTRKSLNKIIFKVFTPCLMFANLSKTVTLEDIISWWFMPLNIGFTYLFGGVLGWIVVKILRPEPHLEGLVIATCASGNLGNLVLIIIPAVCEEEGSPFGDHDICSTIGLSYASFSMALGGFYIWTFSYSLIKSSAAIHRAAQKVLKEPNRDLEAVAETHLLKQEENEQNIVSRESDAQRGERKLSSWKRILRFLYPILEVLAAPPSLAAIVGLIFGATKFLKHLIVGEEAPLRVIHESVQLLGEGTIPCITLILGGNLIQGLRSSKIKPWIIVGVVCVRYAFLPAIGIWIVKVASRLGFLPPDPLFHYVMLIQYTLPPAMNISTMAELFDVGQEECSVLFLWTYLVAAVALTSWSMMYMWILS